MKSVSWFVFHILLSSVSFMSCEESFSPKGPLEERLVVFGILDLQSDIQVIRVHHTYDVAGHNPVANILDPQVDDATVAVTVDDTTYLFGDSLFSRDSQERYEGEIRAYYSRELKVARSKTYHLMVASPRFGRATSVCRTPGNVSIGWKLDLFSQDLIVNATSEGAKGFLIRAFQRWFEIAGDSVVNQGEEEIPLFYIHGSDGSLQPIYPKAGRENRIVFDAGIMAGIQADLVKNPFHKYNFDYVRLAATALDSNYYNYFQIVRGFNDRNSVRLDEPEWTNIVGGFGVFGAVSSHSMMARLR